MSFGTRLRELREDRDLTQKKLAAIIGVSPRMVSFYESGAHFPRDESIIIQLAGYFQVSTDYLLGCSNVPSAVPQEQLSRMFEEMGKKEQEDLLQYADFLLARQRQERRR